MKLSSNSLYIVSTPIGNLDDITLRAIEVLKKSDIILCEDTRHSLKLMSHLKISKKLVSYHKFNEKKELKNILGYINNGKILSIISDAGTPLLSDPGRILINECIKEDIKIIPIPGVSSITTAISVSGFSDQFLFYGFLPKTEKELDKVLSTLSNQKFSIVFFIPSIKSKFYFYKFRKYFIDRKILIGKEMTKLHEFFFRSEIKELQNFKNQLKGELTIVISESAKKKDTLNKEKIINNAKKYLKKYSVKDTVDLIVKTEKLTKNKKEIYKLCLKVKDEKNI